MGSYPTAGQGRDYGYSGLEVVNDHAHQAPELDLRHQADKQAVPAYAENTHHPTTQYLAEKGLPQSPQPNGRIWGMRRSIFWILCAVVGLVVIGAAVGGAVGGSQSSSKSSAGPATTTVPAGADQTHSAPNSSPTSPTSTSTKSSSSTSTKSSSSTSTKSSSSTTSSASASATPIGEGEGTYTCPESDELQYTTSSGTGGVTFNQLCDVDWPVNVTAYSGSATDKVEDLANVLQYSLQDCIDQCAAYSLSKSPPCFAVTYAANITRAQDRGYSGNCWLKTARGAQDTIDTSRQVQSAYIIAY